MYIINCTKYVFLLLSDSIVTFRHLYWFLVFTIISEVISNSGFNCNQYFVRISNTYLKAEITTSGKRSQHSWSLYNWKMTFYQQTFFCIAGINIKMKTLHEQAKMREQPSGSYSYPIIAEQFRFRLLLCDYRTFKSLSHVISTSNQSAKKIKAIAQRWYQLESPQWRSFGD